VIGERKDAAHGTTSPRSGIGQWRAEMSPCTLPIGTVSLSGVDAPRRDSPSAA